MCATLSRLINQGITGSSIYRSTKSVSQVQCRYVLAVNRAMSNEATAARAAADSGAKNKAEDGVPTIFDKIISKEIPAQIIFEDDTVLAFRDINPQAPVHFLVIPKHRNGLTQLCKATEENETVLGHLLFIASKVAKQEGLSNGFRIAINDGVDGCN